MLATMSNIIFLRISQTNSMQRKRWRQLAEQSGWHLLSTDDN